MAGAYSADLRERVLAAVEAGGPVSAVARQFAVGRSTVQDWVWAWRQEGRCGPGKMGGHLKPKVSGDAEAALRGLLDGANYLTSAQCQDRLAEKAGVSVHPSTLHRALRRMGWRWKKRILCAAEQGRDDVVAVRVA